MLNEEAKPLARTADIVTKEVADELLVYDLKTHQAHCLNQTAALIWKYCDGNTTVKEIAVLINNDLKLIVDEAVVWLAIERLIKAKLIDKELGLPTGIQRLTRRETIKRLGVGFTVSVPIIMSIVAPAAAAAASTCISTLKTGCINDPGSPATCGDCADVVGKCWGSNTGCTGSFTLKTCLACPNGPGNGNDNSWSL